jgi:hypothetical protein
VNNRELLKGLVIAILVTVFLLIMAYSVTMTIIEVTGWPAHFRLNAASLAEIHQRAYLKNMVWVAAVVLLWLYSIWDAFRTGRRLERVWSELPVDQRGASPGGASPGGAPPGDVPDERSPGRVDDERG